MDNTWQTMLLRSQEQVATLAPNPYYLSAYRQAEEMYWQYIPRWIADDSPSAEPLACLDIGCAYGTLLLYTRLATHCEAYGIDYTDRYISPLLCATHELRFARCNIELDPLPWSMRYDIILFTEVLEHLNFYPVPTLRKIRGLLAPGGRLYMSTPDAASWGQTTRYYSSFRDLPEPSSFNQIIDDHIWQYSRIELEEVLRLAGLRIERFALTDMSTRQHFNLTLQTMSE